MVDEDENGAPPEETEIEQGFESDAEEEFEAFDEVLDEYKPSAITSVKAEDGLPTQASQEGNFIPPLSTETLVCMGDFSSFVVRSVQGTILQRYNPDQVTRAENGDWYLSVGSNKYSSKVEPIRPPCKHYVRQSGLGGPQQELKVLYRLCSARRTTEGAFMSIRDTGVYACTMREPRDLVSEQKLEDFDNMKIKQGERRGFYSMFAKRV